MKGKGVPLVHSNSRGDELVTVRVVIPQTLTARQKELLKEFAEIERQQNEKGAQISSSAASRRSRTRSSSSSDPVGKGGHQ